jgi:Phage tail lysozyme
MRKSPPSAVGDVLQLQRSVGNAAVAGLLQRQPSGTLAPPGAAAGGATAPARKDWTAVSETDRMAYVMKLLVETYGYPENGAAGLVGNLYEESGLLPNRVEGSSMADPMHAKDFAGKTQDFTADEIMNRKAGKSGPKKPGIGLAQWTTKERRAGLFAGGSSDILYDMDGQVKYLVDELGTSYAGVNKTLKKVGVSVDDASDDVVYSFEIPGSILETKDVTDKDGKPVVGKDGKPKTKKVKRARSDSEVVKVFERRRKSGQRALKAYQASKSASGASGTPASGPASTPGATAPTAAALASADEGWADAAWRWWSSLWR